MKSSQRTSIRRNRKSLPSSLTSAAVGASPSPLSASDSRREGRRQRRDRSPSSSDRSGVVSRSRSQSQSRRLSSTGAAAGVARLLSPRTRSSPLFTVFPHCCLTPRPTTRHTAMTTANSSPSLHRSLDVDVQIDERPASTERKPKKGRRRKKGSAAASGSARSPSTPPSATVARDENDAVDPGTGLRVVEEIMVAEDEQLEPREYVPMHEPPALAFANASASSSSGPLSLRVVSSATAERRYAPASLLRLCLLAIAKDLDFHHRDIARLPRPLADRLVTFVITQMQPAAAAASELPGGPEAPASVLLRVRLPALQRHFTRRFTATQTVAATREIIYSRVYGTPAAEAPAPLSAYGLFQPASAFGKARWLRDEHTLDYYALPQGATVHFRLTQCLLRIRFLGPWETIKTFVVDETWPVARLCEYLARKLELPAAVAYGLKVPGTAASPSRWLKSQDTLSEQGVHLTGGAVAGCAADDGDHSDGDGTASAPLYQREPLLLKRIYFFHEHDTGGIAQLVRQQAGDVSFVDDMSDSEVHREFVQCLDAVVGATFPVNLSTAVKFAALQAQIRFGDRPTLERAIEQLQHGRQATASQARDTWLAEYMPPEYWGGDGTEREPLDVARIEESVLGAWGFLVGLSEDRAKRDYIKLTRSLPTYGFTFFSVRRLRRWSEASPLERGGDGGVRMLLGVSQDCIQVIEPERKTVISARPLRRLAKWKTLHTYLSLYFDSSHAIAEEFTTLEGEAETISELIALYVHNALLAHAHKRDSLHDLLQNSAGAGFHSAAVLASASGVGGSGGTGSPDNGNASPLWRALAASQACRESSPVGGTPPSPLGSGHSPRNVVPHMYLKCPLYVEPRKSFVNPLSREGGARDHVEALCSQTPSANEMRNFLKAVRSLADLTRKRNQRLRVSSLSSTLTAAERAAMEATPLVIRVRLLDSTEHRVQITDTTRDVAAVAAAIGRRLKIRHAEEFSLQTSSGRWLRSWRPIGEQVRHELAKSKSAPSDDEAAVVTLTFVRKFFYSEVGDVGEDPVFFNLLYKQAQKNFVRALLPCTLSEGVRLIATQFQINFGDYSEAIHQPGFLDPGDLRHFCFVDCLTSWGVTFSELELLIYREHKALRGIHATGAKFRYVRLCQSLRMYGVEYFRVSMVSGTTAAEGEPAPDRDDDVWLGFSRDSVSIHRYRDGTLQHEWPLTYLLGWSATHDAFSLDFGNYCSDVISFATTDAESISDYLSDYIDFVQRKIMSVQYARVGERAHEDAPVAAGGELDGIAFL